MATFLFLRRKLLGGIYLRNRAIERVDYFYQKLSTVGAVIDHGTRFSDRATVKVMAGDGGRGVVAYEVVPGARKGSRKRPSGGNGGRGGDVIVEASESISSLYKQHGSVVRGESGKRGRSSDRRGANGNDVKYYVPTGTIVKVRRFDDQESLSLWGEDFATAAATAEVLGEYNLMKDGDAVTVAKGGKGSYGNGGLSRIQNINAYRNFNESNESKKVTSPFGHIHGSIGEIRLLELELRSIADIGLVGKPNAGKSSILAALSAATPEIASYPFTTLRPHVGTCTFHRIDPNTGAILDSDTLQIADVPGLIEGAAGGRGLGIDFLRHVFRARALVFVADASNGLNALLNDIFIIHQEIAASQWRGHEEGLALPERGGIAGSGRPAILFANKFDLLTPKEADDMIIELKRVLPDIGFLDVLTGSALLGDGIPQLANRLRRLIKIDLPSQEQQLEAANDERHRLLLLGNETRQDELDEAQ